MKDLENPDDVRLLVDTFYAAVREDALLNPIFTDVARVDWVHHLPKMYAFWNALLLGIPGYQGSPFLPHQKLPVAREHFQRWVALFHGTIDRHFAGARADHAKNAAADIARTFAMRLGLIEPIAGRLL